MSIYHNPNDKLYYYCVLCGYNSTPNQLLAHIRSRHKTLNAEKRPDVHQLIADRIDYCRQLNANLTAANGSAIQSLPANNVHQLLAAGEGCMTCDSIVGFYRLDAWSAAKPLNKCGCGQKKPGLVECTRCQNRFHWSCHEKVPISGYAGHDFGAYLCKYCRSRDFMIIGRNHLSPHELLLHLRLHYHYAPLKCLGCMDRFPGYAALRLHIQARHGNSKLAIDKGCNTLWSFEPIAELEALIAKAGIDSRLDFIAHTSSPIVVGNVSLREALLSTASGNTLSATTPSSSSTTASPALVDLTDEPNSPPPVIPATVTSAPAVNIQPAQHIYFINTLTSATGHLLYTNIAQQTPSASNVGPTLASNVGQSLAARLTHSLGLQNVAPPSQATNAVQSIPQYNVIKNIPPRLAKVIVTVKQLSDLNLFNGGGADQAFNFFTKHLIQIEKLCHALNVTNQMKQTVYTLLSTALSIPMADLMQRTASAYSEHMIHKNRTHIKKLVDQLIVRTAFTSQKTAQEFQFTEDLVKLLNITYFYKMKQYFRLKIDNPAPDEYLLNFLSNAILPLWSTGNMTCQRLIQNVDSRELKRLFSPLTESQSAAQEVSIGSAPVSVNVSPAAAVVSDAEVIDLSFDSGDEEVAGEQQASEAEAVVNVAVNEIPIETIGEPMNESIAVMNDSLDVSMDTTNDPLNQSMEVTHEEADTVSAVAATADSSPIRVQKFKRLCIKLGHISCVYCIKFDTTGRYVFTGSDDYLIKVWSTLDGRLVATLRGHEHEITDIAVSHDNSLLATGDINYLIFIWCLKSARALQVLKAHTKQITSLAFCPLTQTTASYLVSTGDDGRVCFWRFDSQSRAFNATPDPEIIEQHSKKSGISCSSFSAGGHLLAVGSTDSYITIYAVDNTTGPQKMLSMKYHWGHVDRIHFSHNSLRFVSSSNNVFSDKDIDKDNAFIWHMVDNSWAVIPIKVYLQIGDTRYNYKTLIHEMEWTPDDQYVVTSLTDYSIKIWNSTDGQLLHVLSGHDDEIHVIQCHPTLPHIFLSAGYDAKAILWDLTKGRPLKTPRRPNVGHSRLLRPVRAVRRRRSGMTQTTASYLVSTGDDGRVCFWRFDSQSRAFNATPDPEIIEQHSKKSGISCSSFSAGGHLLAVGSTDSYITIYAVDNTTGPQKMLSMKYHWGHVDRIHFSHNSLRFVSSSNNVFSDKDIDKDNAFIWHMVDNSWAVIPIKVYLQIGDTRYNYKTLIHEMEWTPDDQYVVTSLTDYSIKIWNSTDGQLLHVLSGHDDDIHVIQCHPTLPHIFLSAGYDAKAILWDLTKGRPLKTFTNKKGRAILDASFSPDGRMLATADCYGRFALYGAGDL
ncbi:unnamed protein product, partial [Medioppia subpectinata]